MRQDIQQQINQTKMKHYSILFLFLSLAIFNWAQISNVSDELDFKNPAYHTDEKVHGKGYQASSINTNFYFVGYNPSYINYYQGNVRYQQSLGKWKLGLHATHSALGSYFKNTSLGLSVGHDFSLNRNWSIRPAVGVQFNQFQLAFIESGNIKLPVSNLNTGLQIRYKNWQLFSGISALYSTKYSHTFPGDTTPVYFTSYPSFNLGLKKVFELDSTQRIETTVLYSNEQGFNSLAASGSFYRKSQHFLFGYGYRQFNVGYGRQFAGTHQVMLSFNLNQPSLLSSNSNYRYGFQLNYKRQLMQRASERSFTGTPSF